MLRCISETAGTPSQLLQQKKLTPMVIDGEATPTSQTVVLDTDPQSVLSGIERSITNFNYEGSVKQRVASSKKMKIRSSKDRG